MLSVQLVYGGIIFNMVFMVVLSQNLFMHTPTLHPSHTQWSLFCVGQLFLGMELSWSVVDIPRDPDFPLPADIINCK